MPTPAADRHAQKNGRVWLGDLGGCVGDGTRECFLAHLGWPEPTDVLTHSHRPGNRHRPYHRTRLCHGYGDALLALLRPSRDE
jgi:hypothetical protein